MKPTNFKQLALLVIMAVTALIMWLVCMGIEMQEYRQAHKTNNIGQDTVKVNKSGEVLK